MTILYFLGIKHKDNLQFLNFSLFNETVLNCSPLETLSNQIITDIYWFSLGVRRCASYFFDIHDKHEMGIIILGLQVKKPRCSEVQPLAWNRKAKTQA